MTPVVLITGCSSGFGAAMVPAFRRRGWRVIAGVRGGRERARDLDAEVVDLDITAVADRARAVAKIDRLDCLVNNAGYGVFGPFEESTEAEIRAQLETNLIATMLLTRECLPRIRAARGRIINVSSVLGFLGFPMMSLYCASKFGLEGWSESLHHELRPHGVTVTLVEPSGYRTKFGASLRRPESELADYDWQRTAMRDVRERITARGSTRIDALAERVAAFAGSKSHAMRLRVDSDARWMWALQKWIPESLIGRFFARMGKARS